MGIASTVPVVPTIRSHDGLALALAHLHVRGDRPSVLAVHATGFCKELWLPILGDLPYDRVLMDQRGHGLSEMGPPPFDWADLGRDVLAVADAVTSERRVGLGHSSGGAALLLAESMRPGTFDALVLFEPIVLPPPRVRLDDDPLVAGALRRRPVFESRHAALASFRGRGPFARWDDAVLEAYVEHAFHDRDGGWALRCARETEAEFYASARTHDAWERLLGIGCPVLLVAGADTTAPVAEHLEEQADRLPNSTLRIVPGHGHFLPMEQPDLVREALREGVRAASG